jgi:hypothetical protein
MTSTAMMDAVKDLDPYILAASPAAHQYMQMVAQRQAKEQAVEKAQRLQTAMDRLNKPQEHVVNGKLVRSYADGRTEIVTCRRRPRPAARLAIPSRRRTTRLSP